MEFEAPGIMFAYLTPHNLPSTLPRLPIYYRILRNSVILELHILKLRPSLFLNIWALRAKFEFEVDKILGHFKSEIIYLFIY